MVKQMFKWASLTLALTAMLALAAQAQNGATHPVEGSYKVTAASSEVGTLNFGLVIKKNGDKWTGEFKDAPMPMTVSNITVDADNKVVITADAGGTTVTIQGKLADNKIAGDWTAGDTKGTWTALKDGAAAPAAAEAKAAPVAGAAASIEGTYDFKIIADGQGELPLTLVIKNSDGKLITENPGGGDLLVTGIEVKEGDVVALTATYQGNGPIPLNGKRTGNEMGGKWEFGGFSGTWSAKKK
jgi:hypothetical protein